MDLQTARDHIGSKVVYRPRPDAPAEEGVITGVTDQWVYVRYGHDVHSKATCPEDIDRCG